MSENYDVNSSHLRWVVTKTAKGSTRRVYPVNSTLSNPPRTHRLSYKEVLDEWESLVSEFLEILAESASPFFFECVPVTRNTLQSVLFEFVLVPTSALLSAERRPDRMAFAEHVEKQKPTGNVIHFANLGKDAELVTPVKHNEKLPDAWFSHLAAFSAHMDKDVQLEFWECVIRTFSSRLENVPAAQPLWLSSSGLGVYWLHVRVDTRPKYYTYAPYKTQNQSQI